MMQVLHNLFRYILHPMCSLLSFLVSLYLLLHFHLLMFLVYRPPPLLRQCLLYNHHCILYHHCLH